MQAGQLVRNALIATSFVRGHLVDDPVVLIVQGCQTFPANMVQPVARFAKRWFRSPTSQAGAFGAALTGDIGDLRRRVGAASRTGDAKQLARLTDIALAIHDRALAGSAFDAIPAPQRELRIVQSVGARLAAYDGDLDAAVDWSRRYGERSAVAKRFRGRRDLMSGRPIEIAGVQPYDPIPNRILHVLTNSLPHSPSGYPQRTHSILLALREKGWDVEAVTRIAYPVQVGKPFAKGLDEVDGIKYHRILPWVMAGDDYSARVQQAQEMCKIVERFRPSVLHTTTPFHNAAPVKAVAEAYAIPWIYEVRGQQADTWAAKHGEAAPGSQYYALFVQREAAAAQDCDAVVTLGEQMKLTLLDQGVPDAKITLCPNAVGEAFLREPMSREAARVALGLDPKLQYIGAVSSLVGYEGHDDLIQAFERLGSSRPNLRLVLAGDGVTAPKLHQLARELGVLDRCIFPGRVPRGQAHVWHQALDVFVVPRKDLEVTRKVTPLKPVEASASRRPVVASRLPALEELVRDGETGLLAEPNDPDSLAEKLALVIDDPEYAHRLGDNGRSWVLKDRTWAANAVRYTEVYKRLGGVP